ncbi:hypothetical protein PA7_09460 [Pseudonocardia asaccharolytica DSM 44247 = NBRC 16224]|uniref:PASTA domain-containing protein n=1 Tax=Pseudonocardia asaccharolytica DSM 44247 = NBRC 16224 TaxID=1123024 RepID=A0A511CX18_9PSEU|nr:hypothetical protein PA7_09460 [Pseudonocardia asaccharolytica DSM 44247 = NBRC 16224]
MLVPALVGLDVREAHQLSLDAGVIAVNPDPDTPPARHGAVVAQRPTAGTQVNPGDPVTIWVDAGPEQDDTDGDDGGGGGGRWWRLGPRPRPPKPAGTK